MKSRFAPAGPAPLGQDAAHQVGHPAAGAVTPSVARDRQLREKETQGIDAALQVMIEGREIGL